MSNSYLTEAARVAGMGRDQGLTDEEIVDGLYELRKRKERKGARAIDGEDRRAAAAFDMAAAGVPSELSGFGYGNGGEDIEFGVDQADWQIAQADDKDIVAKKRKRAEQAAADIGFDERMREQGDGARVRRAQAMMELREGRAAADNIDGRTDWRMQFGPRTVQGQAQIPFLNPIQVSDRSIREDPFLKGKRGADHNLLKDPDQLIRRYGKERFQLEREPNFAGAGNQQAIIDAQIRLVNAVRKGEVSAQEAAPIIQKLNEQVNPLGGRGVAVKNPALQADRRQARAVAANDAVGAAAMLRAVQNDADAELEAKLIGMRGGINREMSAIPDIKDVGNLKVKLPAKAGGFNEGQYFPEAVQDGIAPAFDASGIPLGVQGPVAANTPDTSNTLNAPRDVRQWAIQNAPGYKENGRVFGDFPQVDIMGAGNDFLERIARIKAGGQAFDPGISAIRNIDDLEGVVGRFGEFADQGGLKMFALDGNQNEVFRSQVGLPEIFQKMKMNPNGQARLANALFQLEAAKANGVNNEQRAVFEGRAVPAQPWRSNPAQNVQFGARQPAFGNDEAQLQKIPRGQIQVGVDAVGQPIKQELMAALQGLQGNQAQPPLDANELRDARNGLVGLVQGEGRGRNSVYGFAKPIPEGVSPRGYFRAQAEARAKPGKAIDIGRVNQNANIWQRIVDREKAARNAPNVVLGVQQQGEREIRDKEAMMDQDVKQRIQPQMERAERDELKRLIIEGPRNGDGLIRVPLEVRSARRMVDGKPEAIERGKGFKFDDEVVRHRTERFMGVPNEILPANKGIIPMKDRGGNLGNQVIGGVARVDGFRQPVAQAAGGGMGGGNRPTAVAAAPSPDPWQTPPATGGGFTNQVQRDVPTSMMNVLAELNSGPTQGPRTPGIRQKIMNSIKRAPTNFVSAPRRQRVGAVAGGAILGAMGIDGLVSGERDRREQEQYQ